MKYEVGIEILGRLIDYRPDTGETLWAERDASFYINSLNPVQSAKTFNMRHAGKPITISMTTHGIRSIFLRFIDQTSRITFDKLLWATISGELRDECVVYLDGNQENTCLNNIALMPLAAKTTKLNPMHGISEYPSTSGSLYRARIQCDGKTMQKSGFKSADEARAWRIEQIKACGQWWAIPAKTAYEGNPYREKTS